MARYRVYSTQASAQAAVEAINANGRALYASRGYTIDANGSIIVRNLATGKEDKAAQHLVTWDIPRKRLDGKWIILHPESHKSSQMIIDDAKSTKAVDSIMVGVISDSIEIDPSDGTWFTKTDPIGLVKRRG